MCCISCIGIWQIDNSVNNKHQLLTRGIVLQVFIISKSIYEKNQTKPVRMDLIWLVQLIIVIDIYTLPVLCFSNHNLRRKEPIDFFPQF